jgi:RNA polymerase sigma-70 factor (ECF subfamily)
MMSMLRRLCRNPHDAEDVFQETAVRVWRNFLRRPLLRSPRAWLMTIAYRTFLDHQARRRRGENLVDPPDDRQADPGRQAEHAERNRRLTAAIDGLPPALRQVIILHYSGGLTIRQTAQAMGLSLGTAKSRLNAALVELRSMLQ